MNRIFCLLGKSATGKDKIYGVLTARDDLPLRTIVPYTTRPIRDKETDGDPYFFRTIPQLEQAQEEGKVIECRRYDTYYGPWYYYTMDDGQIDLQEASYLIATGTLEGYRSLRDYFGEEAVLPLYIRVDEGERLQRALDRERKQKEPKYEEMCRRSLSDAADFSEENIAAAGITRFFDNPTGGMDGCVEEIVAYIKEVLCGSQT